MQKTESKRKVYTSTLALLLLISELYTLYRKISIVRTLLERKSLAASSAVASVTVYSFGLMSEYVGIAAAIAAICLVVMILRGKGNIHANTDHAIWGFYIIGSLVSHILYIIYQEKMCGPFFSALVYTIKNQTSLIMQLHLKQIQSGCLSAGLVVLLLAIIIKGSSANKRKAYWLAGSTALVLHIIAGVLNLLYLKTLAGEQGPVILDFLFDIALDAALFIKLSLETVWADSPLPERTTSSAQEVKAEGLEMK